jgi:replicative DNA helicase
VGEYKGLAEELELPVVICSQLNRKVEERDDKRPRMSDVRDSGQIEEYADTMLGLYREARYNPEADKLAAEILVLKHRDEAPRTGSDSIKVHFQPWFTRFIDAPEGAPQERNDADEKRRRHRSPRRYADNPD